MSGSVGCPCPMVSPHDAKITAEMFRTKKAKTHALLTISGLCSLIVTKTRSTADAAAGTSDKRGDIS